MTGRETELEFHQSFSTIHVASDYITSVGAPMTTDPYKEVGQCAASVLVQSLLIQEYNTPPQCRKQCTRFMRLAVCGDVDTVKTSKIWKTLSMPLHDTVVQSILGRSELTSQELARVPHCSGATFINNIQKVPGIQGCPFCMTGLESRYHWCHECSQSKPGFLHTYVAISHVLPGCDPTLWFDLSRRFCASSQTEHHNHSWWASHNFIMGESTGSEWNLTGLSHHNATPTVTANRCRTLQHHWIGTLNESSSQDMHRVLMEALSPDPTSDTGMAIVSDCQLELKAWLQNVFTIEGERLT